MKSNYKCPQLILNAKFYTLQRPLLYHVSSLLNLPQAEQSISKTKTLAGLTHCDIAV